MDELICLKSKAYLFKCARDNQSELKSVSKTETKHFKFVEEYNGLYGGANYKECDKYIIEFNNREIYLQRKRKSALADFNVKRCYIKEIESEPWE